MKENRSRAAIRLAAFKRLAMWHVLSGPLNLVLVTEFPKAGGSWFCQMLAEAAELPFPRNVAPRLEPCVMHGHHLPRAHFGKTVGIVRDGRDIAVSAYFHFLFENERNSPFSVRRHRARCGFDDYADVRGNLPAFIDYLFGAYARERTGFTWSEFGRACREREHVHLVRYEDVLTDPASAVGDTLAFLGRTAPSAEAIAAVVARNSFAAQRAALTPASDGFPSFLRRGVAGDWKNHFSAEARVVFARHGGSELEALKYEVDDSWVGKAVEPGHRDDFRSEGATRATG